MLENPELVTQLSGVMSEALPDGYSFDEDPAERHGSWEWIAARSGSDGIAPAVVIALTDLSGRDGSARVDVDLWAAADTDERFIRLPVRHAEFLPADEGQLLELSSEMLPEAIRAAAEIAERFSDADLNEAYARPSPITHPKTPDDGSDDLPEESPYRWSLRPLQRQILSLLEEEGELTIEELAGRLGAPLEAVRGAVEDLRWRGNVVVVGSGTAAGVRLRRSE